jgi:hypothetical protein
MHPDNNQRGKSGRVDIARDPSCFDDRGDIFNYSNRVGCSYEIMLAEAWYEYFGTPDG